MSETKETKKDKINNKRKKNIYIFITNSLQNDFLEYFPSPDGVEGWESDYMKWESKWVDHFKEYPRIPSEEDIDKFLESQKLPANTQISYLDLMKKNKHRVHVDYQETKRVWDDNSLADFIDRIAKQDSEECKKINNENEENKESTKKNKNSTQKNDEPLTAVYYYIHLRDWHDPTDNNQLKEFKTFGPHCIKGTHGAQFIEPIQRNLRNNETRTFIVNSNSLSSFKETNLESVLESIMNNEECPVNQVKIGVIGAITNVKLKLLAFELSVVHGYSHISVCEDFCVAFNESGQKEGIRFMEYALNIKVLNKEDFIKEFQIKEL